VRNWHNHAVQAAPAKDPFPPSAGIQLARHPPQARDDSATGRIRAGSANAPLAQSRGTPPAAFAAARAAMDATP